MTDEKRTEDVPELPDMPREEKTQTVGTATLILREKSDDILGRDIAADLSGMAASSTEVPLNRALVSSINYVMASQKGAMERAEEHAKAKEAECVALRAEAKAASIEVASLKATLAGLRESSGLRAVINTLSGVVLGLTPFAYDKGGFWGAVVVAAVGVVLIGVAWLRKP